MLKVLHDPVLLILLAASLASWAIIVDRLLALWRSLRADGTKADGAPLAQLAAAFATHPGKGRDYLATVMDAAIAQQRQRLEGPLPLLGVIGSIAPYIGLFGTVVGIIQAFDAIKTHNVMSPTVVSGGIAAALIATAAGLGVAIPAVAAHHLLSAAIARRAAAWEAEVATWLPDEGGAA
jgi:biopolymer transport protein ExbB/TolQ